MAWIAISQDTVVNSLTQQEQSQMTDPSSATDMANIIANVTSFVRGKVQSWQPNQNFVPYPAGMIPEELMAAAIAICRYKFLTHLPGTQLITKWREAENTGALALLNDVATGKMIILAPTNLDGTVPPVPSNPADSDGEWYWKPYPSWVGYDRGPYSGGYW
jgi:hypothetical protein